MTAICADKCGQRVFAEFASEIVGAVVGVQIAHRGLVAAAPLHASAANYFGAWQAAVLAALCSILLSHAVGVLLTIPALVGVNRWKIQVNRSATLQRVVKDMPVILRNFAISVAVLGASTIFMASDEYVLLDVTLRLPSSFVVAWQTAFCMVVTEIWFYHVHRLFHENKHLYAMVHKLHHTWPAPVAIVATFAHPVEHIGCNLASILLGPLLCGAHPVTTMAYTLVFAIGAYAHHSGYWSDDLGMHDYHHEAFNVNYGNAHLLDFLYGTYRTRPAAANGAARSSGEKD